MVTKYVFDVNDADCTVRSLLNITGMELKIYICSYHHLRYLPHLRRPAVVQLNKEWVGAMAMHAHLPYCESGKIEVSRSG